MIRTLVAEHVHLLRIGLVAYLTQEPGIEVVADLEEGGRLVSTAAEVAPEVAVIDVDLPPEGGATVAGTLTRTVPACATVMLVGRDDPGDLGRAMSVRPLGLITREAPVELLTWCVRRVASGRRVVDPDLASTARAIDENPLTHRERQILRIASAGASTAEIAAELSVSAKTVRNHLSRAFVRIGARNRMDAIRIATEREWLGDT
ncbi:response regulator transcription factor [Actinoallomurus iriomotensis]|uniref:DNA-binding response regulator n=1 Tax=Actinoallomurus iriomotensis TaxID=478107 RepID=A0A9W6S4L9_9ACTN|nr:response regulator transcription factor [Actinoallomurus iriomotensis]GLY88155.1 DNA-binding response regulator [Actinoallomurus iriomotensis]